MHRDDHSIWYEYLDALLISATAVLLIGYIIHLCPVLVVAVVSNIGLD